MICDLISFSPDHALFYGFFKKKEKYVCTIIDHLSKELNMEIHLSMYMDHPYFNIYPYLCFLLSPIKDKIAWKVVFS